MANLAVTGPFSGRMPEATGQVVAMIRKPERWAINRWVKYIPTPVKNAYYVQLGFDQPVRVYSDDAMGWEDGAARDQMGEDNKLPAQFIPFRTFRRNRAWTLGWETINLTNSFKIKPAHMDMCISQIMTNRTNRFVQFVTSTANWGNNFATCNTLNGGRGFWDEASDDPANPGYNAILATMQNAVQRVHLATNGMIGPGDFKFVVGPDIAIKASRSSEMRNYCRESPYSMEILTKGLDPQFQKWGLPSMFNGYEFIVEDAVIVTEQVHMGSTGASAGPITEATLNRSYIWPANTAVMVARPGALDGEYGTKEYSTLQLYHYGNLLEVEAFDDPENHRIKGHVSEDTKEVTVPITGFCITNVLSPAA